MGVGGFVVVSGWGFCFSFGVFVVVGRGGRFGFVVGLCIVYLWFWVFVFGFKFVCVFNSDSVFVCFVCVVLGLFGFLIAVLCI